MVLSTNEKKELSHKLSEEHYKYTVLDTSHIKGQYNNYKFKSAIELLDICNYVTWGNEMLKKVNTEKHIDLGIIYYAMDAVLTDSPFDNNEELRRYFEVRKKIEELAMLIEDFSDFRDGLCGTNVDLLLLGFTLKAQSLTENEVIDELFEKFADTYDDFLNDSIDVNVLIKKSKNLFRTFETELEAV